MERVVSRSGAEGRFCSALPSRQRSVRELANGSRAERPSATCRDWRSSAPFRRGIHFHLLPVVGVASGGGCGRRTRRGPTGGGRLPPTAGGRQTEQGALRARYFLPTDRAEDPASSARPIFSGLSRSSGRLLQPQQAERLLGVPGAVAQRGRDVRCSGLP